MNCNFRFNWVNQKFLKLSISFFSAFMTTIMKYFIITLAIFTQIVHGIYDAKTVREQVDRFQLEIVKMSIQFSNTLKQKTGRGLEVNLETKKNKIEVK